MKLTKGEKIFNLFNIVVLSGVLLVTLYPFYYTLIASISDGLAIIQGKVILYPVKPTFKAYLKILEIDGFFRAYANTIYITVMGTAVQMVVTTMGAYSLSRKRLVGRKFFNIFISFTMWFSAGMIPMYLNFDNLNLINSFWGVILGWAVNTFYFIIMRTFFEGLPSELEDAAKIDGMGNFGTFLKVMLPISTPCLATITLYYGVDRWNGYFWSMLLLKKKELIPLQVLLKKIIVEMRALTEIQTSTDFTNESIVYALVIVAIIPVIIVYPYAQRFFIKGITVGAVKG